MEPVTLYFAGSESGIEGGLNSAKDKGFTIHNRLVSYMYPKDFWEWLKYTGDEPGQVILDSGAFSAWNRGKIIDVGEYIAFCKQAQRAAKIHNKKLKIVNLDVIPGRKGMTAQLNKIDNTGNNRRIINDAASRGYQNLVRMKDEGITPIHVFHQGEDWEWLHKMVELTDYIGVSPANDISIISRLLWMRRVFEYMYEHNIKVKTHGFAVWMVPVLKHLPFTSCDAATAVLLAAWGGVYYPIGGFSNPDYSRTPHMWSPSERKSYKGVGAFSPVKMEFIEKDGYTFDDLQKWWVRTEINIRYMLGFEKWLATYRATEEFKPRPKFF